MKRVTPDAKAGTGGLRHEAIDHEVLIGPRVVRPLFRRSATVSLGVAAIVIAAGVAGLALGVGRAPTRRSHHAAVRPRLPTCRPAGASAPSAAPTELGAWPYDLTMPGTFEMITAAQGSLFALEACGAEESSLRVVEIDERSGSAIASAAFGRAAPIASSIAVTTEGLFFGESRLVLGGTAGTPPYRLSIVELAPRDLKVVRTIPVGRGYGLTLLDGPGGSLLVSTGRQLLEVDASGTVHTVASFPGAVVQHVAVVPGSGLVLASLFTPSAMAPAASTRLALVDLRSGLLVSDLSLPVGEEVESLVAGPGGALVAVSDGDSTEVERVSADAPLRSSGLPPHGVRATLAPVVLLASGPNVFVAGLGTLACTNASSGATKASTGPDGPAEVPSGIARIGAVAYAVTPAGLGRVRLPAACVAG
ncbi:MAG: hypothetical protein ACLQK4_14235 [Acidimicrobiales bacterium]|jgi:hypothetical protein